MGEGHPTCAQSNALNVNLIALKARSSLTVTVLFQSLSKGKKLSIGNSQARVVNETCAHRSPMSVAFFFSLLFFQPPCGLDLSKVPRRCLRDAVVHAVSDTTASGRDCGWRK